MKELGFDGVNKQDVNAWQTEPDKSRYVAVGIRTVAGVTFPDISYSVRINRVEELWEDYISEMGLLSNKGFYKTFGMMLRQAWPEVKERPDYNTMVSSIALEPTEEGVEKFYHLFKFILIEKMFPIGKKLENIMELDHLMNRSPVEQRALFTMGKELLLRRLIVARLANNPDWETIFEEGLAETTEREKTDPFFKNYPAVLTRVHERLKSEQP